MFYVGCPSWCSPPHLSVLVTGARCTLGCASFFMARFFLKVVMPHHYVQVLPTDGWEMNERKQVSGVDSHLDLGYNTWFPSCNSKTLGDASCLVDKGIICLEDKSDCSQQLLLLICSDPYLQMWTTTAQTLISGVKGWTFSFNWSNVYKSMDPGQRLIIRPTY